jgi:hypothetical protein
MPDRRTIRITPVERGWEVLVEGDRGGLLFMELVEAVSAAREWAAQHPGARIVLFDTSGSPLEEISPERPPAG